MFIGRLGHVLPANRDRGPSRVGRWHNLEVHQDHWLICSIPCSVVHVAGFKEAVTRTINIGLVSDVGEFSTRHTPNARADMVMWTDVAAKFPGNFRGA